MKKVMLFLCSLLLLSSLVACSSPKVDYSAPYCYTDQSIKMIDKTQVSSTTNLECTDKPGPKLEIQRAGIDKACKQFFYDEVRRGHVINQRGIYCEYPNGQIEILDIDGVVR